MCPELQTVNMQEMELKHYFTTAGAQRGILEAPFREKTLYESVLDELHWENPDQYVLKVLWVAYNKASSKTEVHRHNSDDRCLYNRKNDV